MKLTKVLMAVAIIATLGFVSCKPKDADIKAKIEAALKASPDMASTMVDVKDGVVTLTGECKDETCKANCAKAVEDLKVKGVKSVMNNCTVKPAVMEPASTTASAADPKLQDAVKAIIKDIPGISIEGFSDKGVILKGDISKDNNKKLKQAMAAAKIMMDATASKLMVK